MKIEKTGTKADTFVKLAMVFLISLLSFSIGTYVGKKYSDNQYKLSALEPQKKSEHDAARGVASVASGHEEDVKSEGEKSESLTDEEIKKLAEEFVADDSAPSEDSHGATNKPHPETATHKTEEVVHGEVPVVAATAATTGHDSHDSTAKAAVDVMEGKTPVAEKKVRNPSAIADTLPKDVAQYSVGKYTVQIASFPTEKEAKKKADELKQKGYSAFFIPAQINGKGTYYRVSVGLFSTEKEAKEYRDDFKEKLKVSSAIIQKISE
jgi:cell division septation protein DedD